MFIPRSQTRTEHDDFLLNVQNHVSKYTCASPVYDKNSKLCGWVIKPMYE